MYKRKKYKRPLMKTYNLDLDMYYIAYLSNWPQYDNIKHKDYIAMPIYSLPVTINLTCNYYFSLIDNNMIVSYLM